MGEDEIVELDYAHGIPLWVGSADAAQLPYDVVAELYPDYLAWGPEPKRFIEVGEVLQRIVTNEINCNQFLSDCALSSKYLIASRLLELQQLEGDIGYRAAFMASGIVLNEFEANLRVRIRTNGTKASVTKMRGLHALFSQMQTTRIQIGFETVSTIYALYASVVDRKLGYWLYPDRVREQVRSAYEALQAQVAEGEANVAH